MFVPIQRAFHRYLELSRFCLILCSCSIRVFSSLTGLGMKPTSQPSFTRRPIHQSLLYFYMQNRQPGISNQYNTSIFWLTSWLKQKWKEQKLYFISLMFLTIVPKHTDILYLHFQKNVAQYCTIWNIKPCSENSNSNYPIMYRRTLWFV